MYPICEIYNSTPMPSMLCQQVVLAPATRSATVTQVILIENILSPTVQIVAINHKKALPLVVLFWSGYFKFNELIYPPSAWRLPTLDDSCERSICWQVTILNFVSCFEFLSEPQCRCTTNQRTHNSEGFGNSGTTTS